MSLVDHFEDIDKVDLFWSLEVEPAVGSYINANISNVSSWNIQEKDLGFILPTSKMILSRGLWLKILIDILMIDYI